MAKTQFVTSVLKVHCRKFCAAAVQALFLNSEAELNIKKLSLNFARNPYSYFTLYEKRNEEELRSTIFKVN